VVANWSTRFAKARGEHPISCWARRMPTLKEQCAEIPPRAGARLKENGCDWHNVVRVSFMLHKSEKPQSVLDIASAIVPVPLENAEIELVEGYSTPGKLVEIEVTARR
jgi:hypothetical protein